MSEQFIGAGWAFPPRTDQTGGIALVTRDAEIDEAIRLILGTAVGERPMRPEFGSRLHQFLFSAADATTAGLIAHDVRTALERWEPRIVVREVEVTIDENDASLLYIDIDYSVRTSNDRRNLVFPFYVIPPEETP